MYWTGGLRWAGKADIIKETNQTTNGERSMIPADLAHDEDRPENKDLLWIMTAE